MTLKKKLAYCSLSSKALLATNFYNYETLKGLLQAAKEMNTSIILQLSESSLQYLGINPAVQMARAALKEFEVEGWIHLDHGSSIQLVQRCLDAGFDSVMIDASEVDFKENIQISTTVVKMAEPYQAAVEAELGYIPKLNQEQTLSYTQPEEAKNFVEATGVDALAIAIGSAHGFYKEPPVLQLDLLHDIHQITPAALVLHGSSGIPDDQLKLAIKNGISKINLATETKNTFMKQLKQSLAASDDIDLRNVFPPAIASVKELICTKLSVISC
ncbi:MAG TPA: class II fructose-bisphosphate aldolase [Flavisolibacter sp.]|jgi:fructose-bisphosphate aldolase class II/tagatose 1,6-diphosphate aldolase GatY/KbaY|nr:class II fructose-bisphosphate aldolase [Flavisolibacter sp.]